MGNKNVWLNWGMTILLMGTLVIGLMMGCRNKDDDKTVSSSVSGWTKTSNPSTYGDLCEAIFVDDNYVYVGGYVNVGEGEGINPAWRLEKRDKAQGNLVKAFGNSGAITTDPGPGSDSIRSIAGDNTYLYLCGYEYLGGMGDQQWRIEKRHQSDGQLVTEFGIALNGVITSNPSNQDSGAEYVTCMMADDTYLYIGGIDCSLASTDAQWRLEKRDKISGALVPGFGITLNGVVTSNPGSLGDVIMTVALDDTYLYLAGYERLDNEDLQWRIEKRDKISGTLVAGFGVALNGVITSNPYAGLTTYDYIVGIAVDESYLYIGGYSNVLNVPPTDIMQSRIEKRDKNTGALMSTFGTNGVVQSDPSKYIQSYAMTIDNNFIYLVGCDLYAVNDAEWRIEKRFKTTGGQ